jgi:2-amino-4-hydroxy-6-hydroxymethyldihydropteridine diphosphokinase
MSSFGTLVALSLGGNVGNVKKAFDIAVTQLERYGLTELSRSPIYRTQPVGFDQEVPDFLNAVVTGRWNSDASTLHEECKKIEQMAGRPEKHEPWASRTLDLDIILFGDEIIHTPTLTIPHPEAQKRFFVLAPLNEIAGNWGFPDNGKMVADVLDELTKNSSSNEVLTVERWQ